MKKDVIEKIVNNKIIAIVRGYTIEECIKLARALYEGGVCLMEVTFPQTNQNDQMYTADTIKALKAELGSVMEFGAGTVTSVEMVKMAYDAGCTFIISPDTDIDVITETVKLGMVSIPGSYTPSEMKQAVKYGADFVKIFPADHVGASYFKTVKAPLSQVKMLAVGGVNGDNIKDFLAAGAYGAGVASCLFKKEWIKAGEWQKIIDATKKFVAIVRENL